MKIAIASCAIALMFSQIVSAAVIRLPCRCEDPSSMANTPFAVTSEKQTAESLLPRALDISKYTADGITVIKFVARTGHGSDVPYDQMGAVPFNEKHKFINAVKAILKKQQQVMKNPEESAENVYDSVDVSIKIISDAKNGEAFGELTVDQAIFVLRDNSAIENLLRVVDSLK